MKEFNIEIEIDENGNITADTRGFHGKVCEKELDDLLEGIDGESEDKKKPEYFAKEQIVSKANIKSKLQ
jgi:hypothetical protein